MLFEANAVKVSVNREQCDKIASVLKDIDLPEEDNHIKGETKEERVFFAFLFIGLCHQINYDFLCNAFHRIQKEQPEKFAPKYIQNISNEELYSWLKDYSKPERIQIEKRAELAREMCRVLVEKYSGNALNVIEKADYDIEKIYKELGSFKAYKEDPIKKKSSLLIAELEFHDVLKLKNWNAFQPIIDYNMVRPILRLGAVKVQDKELFEKLKDYSEATLEEDLLIRKKTAGALKRILSNFPDGKEKVGKSAVFWHTGRNCCEKEKPCCSACVNSGCSLSEKINPKRDRCLFSDVCLAAKDSGVLRLKEPNFITTFY